MTVFSKANNRITFDILYHKTEQITLCITEILYIGYHNREVRLVDWNNYSYRLRIRSINLLKKEFIHIGCIQHFYSVKGTLIPLHHIARNGLTVWNEETEQAIRRFTEINNIPLPETHFKAYFEAFIC
ncbi:MAG: hypothetical protein ACRCX4_12050 [Bacteroidales bacterium]